VQGAERALQGWRDVLSWVNQALQEGKLVLQGKKGVLKGWKALFVGGVTQTWWLLYLNPWQSYW
jgi:hypothetical protein